MHSRSVYVSQHLVSARVLILGVLAIRHPTIDILVQQILLIDMIMHSTCQDMIWGPQHAKG